MPSAERTPNVDQLIGQWVVVTGGSGFIGGHVVAGLCGLGANVLSVDRRPAPAFRCHPSSRPGERHSVTVLEGDLRDPAVVDAAVEPGTTAIVHLAAGPTQVLRSLEDPVGTFENNVVVTQALLEAARRQGASAFVFASSNAVVGAGATGAFHEGAPLAPLTPYGATKAAAEMNISCYNAAYGVRGVCLRLTNVYGTGMSEKDSIIPRLMRAAASGQTFDIYGDGLQVRDYVNVADVVQAVVLALTGGAAVSGPLVIGSGQSVSVLDLVALTEKALGSQLDVRHVPAKPGEMPAVVVDNSRVRGLGWSPSVSLEEGLAAVVGDWGGELGAAS